MIETTAPADGAWATSVRNRPDRRAFIQTLLQGWPVLAGSVALGIATLADLTAGPWSGEQGPYGLILLVLSIWLIARRWPQMQAAGSPGTAAIGLPLLGLALCTYVLGRILGWIPIEGIAIYAVLIITLYLFVGVNGLRAAGFPLLYALVVVPPPPALIVTLTAGLRLGITEVAVELLNAAGLVVARSGLTLYVDQYRIAVSDACSGINSLVSLMAIGFFYVHIRGRRLDLPGIVVTAAITLALAILTNFLRVIGIVLLTHFCGVAVAQSFLHEWLGYTVFAIALAGVMLLEARIPRRRCDSAEGALHA